MVSSVNEDQVGWWASLAGVDFSLSMKPRYTSTAFEGLILLHFIVSEKKY